MGRKGLSVEEKREKILAIFHATKKVYNLKELEKLGAKQGVVQQTIKDVNQSLIDDSLVDQDKIGSSDFFWSFPTKAVVATRNTVNSLKEQIAASEEATAASKRKIDELEAERADTQQRREKLARLEDLKKRRAELEAEYLTLKENDPAQIEQIGKLAQGCKEGVNRWTDNTWQMKSWMVKKKGMCSKDVDKYLQISADFDYV